MWREEPGSTQHPGVPAGPPRGPQLSLADWITEDVLQLLYVAGQEIADTRAACPADTHAPLAALRVREAITALREIAAVVNDLTADALGPPALPHEAPVDPSASGRVTSVDVGGPRGLGDAPPARRASA